MSEKWICGGTCADGHGLSNPQGLAVSPDGKSVYVATAGGVARFIRNTTTGAISQPAGTAGCISETGAGPCADGHQVQSAQDVAVSPDGKTRLRRCRPGCGALGPQHDHRGDHPAGRDSRLRQRGRNVRHVRRRPWARRRFRSGGEAQNGKSVYIAAEAVGARRSPLDSQHDHRGDYPAGRDSRLRQRDGCGACANGHALDTPESVAVSADGKSVYVASSTSSAVARLNRNTTTGAIAQPAGIPGCVSESGTGGTCANGHALIFTGDLAVSLDGKSVYVTSGTSDAVARLTRNTTSGAISQPAGIPGCVSETGVGPCANGHALVTPASVAVSANGKSVYVASVNSDAVARFNRAP